MDKLDSKEKIWGGIFGVIAIIAALAEMLVSGISTETALGAIKDIAGTLIVVVLLVAFLRSLMPKKYDLTFEQRLADALTNWQKDNSNMIVKKADSDGNDHYGLSMKTDPTSFFTRTSDNANAGWFVRLPVIDAENYDKPGIKVLFNLNRGTYFEKRTDLTDEEKKQGLSSLADKLRLYMMKEYGDIINNIEIDKNNSITLTMTLKNPIVTNEEIDRLIRLINDMYRGCLVAANIDLLR